MGIHISRVCPIAVLAGEDRMEVTLFGSGIAAEGVTLSARMQGAGAGAVLS